MPAYTHPRSLQRSTIYKLTINDVPVETLHTGVADFAIHALAPAEFPARVEVVSATPLPLPPDFAIRPVSRQISADFDAARMTIRFTVARPEHLSIDPGYGRKPLYLFLQAPEVNPPAPGTPGVVALPAGQITEVADLTLENGQTLYLPGGAVLKGNIHIEGRRGVRICGHGVIDGSYGARANGKPSRLLVIKDCADVLIEDVTLVRPLSWTVVLGRSRGVHVRNIHSIGELQACDGIDIVGTSDVVVENSFLHHNDDCVAVKSMDIGRYSPEVGDCRRSMENILVRGCTLANWHSGNAMEIGHELCCDTIRGVTFRDIDVLHVHGTGAVFSIHNVDRALVSDIVWEDIRIEHCYDKLIDFRVTASRYSTELADTGGIRGVVLRDIRWDRTRFNAGYTTSLISGRDAAHPVEDVVIERFLLDGKPVAHLDELDIHTRHCTGLRLVAPGGANPKAYSLNPRWRSAPRAQAPHARRSSYLGPHIHLPSRPGPTCSASSRSLRCGFFTPAPGLAERSLMWRPRSGYYCGRSATPGFPSAGLSPFVRLFP